MNITIKTIPDYQQRYSTKGDWFFDHKGDLEIRISDVGDWHKEFLIAFHELAEVALCKEHGITQKQVDEFDIDFEKKRKPGDISEPGDDPSAPYQNEHNFATAAERMMCAALGIKWSEYEDSML